jgi:GNAT superfamily N-acetyltransferase
MEVRPCSTRDLERVRAQWPSYDDVAGWHYERQHDGSATFLVCWKGAEPIGWALVQWRGCVGENARVAFPRCIEVNHLQVRAQWRGHGAGSAILAAAEQRVRERGLSQLADSDGLENLDAARLYQRLGYRPTGVLDDCSYSWHDEDGARHDELETSQLLVKNL